MGSILALQAVESFTHRTAYAVTMMSSDAIKLPRFDAQHLINLTAAIIALLLILNCSIICVCAGPS